MESRRQGRLVTLEHCASMADAVVRKTGEEYLYPYIEKYVDDILTVTEDGIRQAVRTACLYGKLTLEGSGALALGGTAGEKVPAQSRNGSDLLRRKYRQSCFGSVYADLRGTDGYDDREWPAAPSAS